MSTKNMEVLEYGCEGEACECMLRVGCYMDGGLAVQLYEVDGSGLADLTVNLGVHAPWAAFIDVNDPGDRGIRFVERYGLGVPTGIARSSGFVDDYPLYIFDIERLAELDPEGVAHYQASLEESRGVM